MWCFTTPDTEPGTPYMLCGCSPTKSQPGPGSICSPLVFSSFILRLQRHGCVSWDCLRLASNSRPLRWRPYGHDPPASLLPSARITGMCRHFRLQRVLFRLASSIAHVLLQIFLNKPCWWSEWQVSISTGTFILWSVHLIFHSNFFADRQGHPHILTIKSLPNQFDAVFPLSQSCWRFGLGFLLMLLFVLFCLLFIGWLFVFYLFFGLHFLVLIFHLDLLLFLYQPHASSNWWRLNNWRWNSTSLLFWPSCLCVHLD